MEILRIIILVSLVWFVIVGIRRGLLRQVFDIVGIVAAFLAAFYFAHALATWIEARTSADYRVALVTAALAIFAGIVIGVHFLAFGLKKLFGLTIMGFVDRVAGGMFGALKGVLIVSFVLSVVMVLPVSDEVKADLRDDPLTGAIYPVLPVVFDLVAEKMPGGAGFEQIARIKESDTVREARRKLNNLKEDFEKSRKRLEDDPGD